MPHPEKRFSPGALQAADGELTGRIVSNSLTRQPPALEYQIKLNFAPFLFAGEIQKAVLNLHAIPLDIRSWRQLSGRDCDFTDAQRYLHISDGQPSPGGVQGGIHLLGEHMPASCTRLAFGAVETGEISAELAITLDLAKIHAPKAALSIKTMLRLGAISVIGDAALLARPKPDEAIKLAEQFLDTGDYERQSSGEVTIYQPK